MNAYIPTIHELNRHSESELRMMFSHAADITPTRINRVMGGRGSWRAPLIWARQPTFSRLYAAM